MSSNRLSLNPSKTQLIWLGTCQHLLKLDFALLGAQFPQFTFLTSVRDLGVTLDNTLSFSADVSNLSRSSFYHLRRLRAVRRSVSMPVLRSMVHAFVCSRIDYCNFLLIGLPKSRLAPLQSVLNAAARLIAPIPQFSHIQKSSIGFLFLHGFTLRLTSLFRKPIWDWLLHVAIFAN